MNPPPGGSRDGQSGVAFGPSAGAAFAGLGARALALAALLLIVLGPAPTFFALRGVPSYLRVAVVVAAVAAAIWPKRSLLVFIAGVPLLATLPSIAGWRTFSLGQIWVMALLVPAFARVVLGLTSREWTFGRDRVRNGVRAPASRAWRTDVVHSPASRHELAPEPAMPLAGWLLLLIVTLSLIVTLYPYQLAAGGLLPVIRAAWMFWRDDFLTVVSQRHLYASISSWAILVEGLAALWLVRWTLRDDGRAVWQACTAVCVGGLAVAVLGVVQWQTGLYLLEYWRFTDPYVTRINATFTDVNTLGTYLAMVLMPACALATWPPRSPSRAWTWGWRAGTALIGLALLFTASRSGWGAAIAAALVYWGVLRAKRTAANGLRAWRIPIAIASIAFVVLAALTVHATARNITAKDQRSYLDTIYYTLNMRLSLNERFKGRFVFWDAALQMMRERPVAGMGIGRYYKLMPKYLEDAGAKVVQENAHNYFLQIGAELGLVGLLALCGLMATAAALALRTAWISDDPAVTRMAAAIGAAVVALMMTSGTGHPLLLHEGQLTFWPLAALAWLFYARELRVRQLAPARRPRTSSLRPIALAAASIALIASVPFRASAEIARINLERMPAGVHGPELASDGSTYRWTAARATLHVPRDATSVILPLRSLAPMPQIVNVSRDGKLVDRVRLDDHNWHELRYVLRDGESDERYYRFDLDISPTFRPPTDPRDLGVMLGDYRWTRATP